MQKIAIILVFLSFLFVSGRSGIVAAEPQTTLSSLPEVEISDFGRKVAEEFLYKFESLFFPHFIPDGRFWWDNASIFIDRFGNEFPAAHLNYYYVFVDWSGNEVTYEVPFIWNIGLGSFLANDFFLYDLENNGIPDIVITFVHTTWTVSKWFRFIDGQYVQLAADPGINEFFYDQDGRMVARRNGRLFHISFYNGIVHEERIDIYTPAYMIIEWREMFGLTTKIPSLINLNETIRQTIMERFFPYLHRKNVYLLQVGAFSTPSNAFAVAKRLRQAGYWVTLERFGDFDRVIVVIGSPADGIYNTVRHLGRMGFRNIWIRQP